MAPKAMVSCTPCADTHAVTGATYSECSRPSITKAPLVARFPVPVTARKVSSDVLPRPRAATIGVLDQKKVTASMLRVAGRPDRQRETLRPTPRRCASGSAP